MKKFLAIFCALAICVSLFAAVAISVNAENAAILVGYDNQDANPYKRHYLDTGETGIGDPYYDEAETPYYYWWKDVNGNTCYELLPLPLRGTITPMERICADTLIDDNGDGIVDENDGLSVTSIAISQDGNDPILLVSTEMSITNARLVKEAKAAIIEAVKAETGIELSKNHIMITSSNTSGSVDLYSYNTDIIFKDEDEITPPDDSTEGGTGESGSEGGTGDSEVMPEENENTGSNDTTQDDTTGDSGDDESGEIDVHAYYDLHDIEGNIIGEITGQEVYDNLAQWYDRLIDQIALSAVNAINDQSVASMSKGSIDASEASSKMFNSHRHITRMTADGEILVQAENSTSVEYEGDSMQLSDTNDTLSLLKFSFDAEENKDPVLLANFTAIANLNVDNDTKSYYSVTSDYINCFRNAMTGYRVGFFQGAGSNLRTISRISGQTKWITTGIGDKNGDGICSGTELAGNIYGAALAEVANICLANNMSDAATGEVGFVDLTYNAVNKSWDDELAYWAAKAAITYYELTGEEIQIFNPCFCYPTVVESLDGLTAAMDAEQLEKLGQYKLSGESYIIASVYHAKDIISNYQETYTTEVPISVFTLGDNIAFVTCPGELADRYYGDEVNWESLMTMVKESATPQQDIFNYLSSINLWDTINSSSIGGSYGTPFVLGFCNGSVGDLCTNLSYEYNTGSAVAPIGSYETQTTELAPGSGEAVLEVYADLLKYLVTDGAEGDDHAKYEYCNICKEEVMWREVNQSFNNVIDSDGHYFLIGDLECAQKPIRDQQNVCFDLNGHTMTGFTRAFYVYNDTEVNIQDTSAEKTGVVRGYGGALNVGFYGGTLYTEDRGTINFYSGTAQQIVDEQHLVKRGGVVSNRGIFNMYGGTIVGGNAEACGGAVYVNYTKVDDGNGGSKYLGGVFNLYGGEVTGGTSKNGGCFYVQSGCTLNVMGGNITGGTVLGEKGVDGAGNGGAIYAYRSTAQNTERETVVNISGGTITGSRADAGSTIYGTANTYLELVGGDVKEGVNASCIYTNGYVLLKGAANADRIYVTKTNTLTIEGAYTGTAELRYKDGVLTPGCMIGSSENASFSCDDLTIHGGKYAPLVNGEELIASYICNPTIVNGSGSTQYNTLDYALLAYQGGDEEIVLTEDSIAAITYSGDVNMDLNGCNLSGTAVASGKLYCYDSDTADYDATNESGYGIITGDNAAIAECSKENYITAVRDEGTSFHAVATTMETINLRANRAGIYYGALFLGDHIVQDYVESFGVAVSIAGIPVDENGIADHALFSKFQQSDFSPANKTEYTSTVLVDILSDEYSTINNRKYAETPVKGRAYIKLTDGTYLCSEWYEFSLQDVIEATDQYWNDPEFNFSDAQKQDVIDLLNAFPAVLNRMEIPNIKEDAEK